MTSEILHLIATLLAALSAICDIVVLVLLLKFYGPNSKRW